MAKIIHLADTHWGVRNNSLVFLELMRWYYDNVLFQYIVDNGITDIIHGGDLVENRSAANYRMLRYMKESFFDKLTEHGVTLHIIPGNHDIFYRNDIAINAVQELYPNHPNVRLYTTPTDVTIGGVSYLMLPWISPTNYDECMKGIEDSKSDYCVGHLEIAGAKMFRKSTAEHGLSHELFKKFKKVYSGHFHHANRLGAIQYISALFHTTWQCYGDKRGFIVLDTVTGKDEYVENPYCIFERIYYDDADGFEMPELDVLQRELGGRIVELVVTSKHDTKAYQKFRQLLESVDMVDFNVVERYLLTSVDTSQADKIMADAQKESPIDVVTKFATEYSKADVALMRQELGAIYEEAVNKMAEGE